MVMVGVFLKYWVEIVASNRDSDLIIKGDTETVYNFPNSGT